MIVRKITDAIAEKLSAEFPETVLYTEEVKQGLETPCFFILPISVSDVRHTGHRWLAVYSMCTQYVPGSDEPKAECADIEESLYKLLEYITVDGKTVAGIDIHSETTDEVLSFFVSYRMLTLEEPEDALEIMTQAKGDLNVKEKK